MESLEDLEAWKVGMDLVEEVYLIVKQFPKNEEYELCKQLRRATTSIVANVAEGFSRYTSPDKASKFVISRGECSEVKALLLIAIRLDILKRNEAQKALNLCDQTGRLLSGLIKYCHQQGKIKAFSSKELRH